MLLLASQHGLCRPSQGISKTAPELSQYAKGHTVNLCCISKADKQTGLCCNGLQASWQETAHLNATGGSSTAAFASGRMTS